MGILLLIAHFALRRLAPVTTQMLPKTAAEHAMRTGEETFHQTADMETG